MILLYLERGRDEGGRKREREREREREKESERERGGEITCTFTLTTICPEDRKPCTCMW